MADESSELDKLGTTKQQLEEARTELKALIAERASAEELREARKTIKELQDQVSALRNAKAKPSTETESEDDGNPFDVGF